MLNECGNHFTPNYSKVCCLKHLVNLNEHAESHLLLQKYAGLLLRTLNHHYKLNSLPFEQTKLDVLKIFLEVVSKYSSKFYFYSK